MNWLVWLRREIAKLWEAIGEGVSVAWADITGKPTEFNPTAHTHGWSEVTGKPTEFTPSAHTHDWSEVDNKPEQYPPAEHQHSWSEVSEKPTEFPPSAHTHDWSEIDNKPNLVVNNSSFELISLCGNYTHFTRKVKYLNGIYFRLFSEYSRLAYSYDAHSWKYVQAYTHSHALIDVIYHDGLYYFLAEDYVYTSSDLVNFNSIHTGLSFVNNILYDYELNKFIVTNIFGEIFTGISLSSLSILATITINSGAVYLTKFKKINGKYFAMCSGANKGLAYSDDLTTWNESLIIGDTFNGVTSIFDIMLYKDYYYLLTNKALYVGGYNSFAEGNVKYKNTEDMLRHIVAGNNKIIVTGSNQNVYVCDLNNSSTVYNSLNFFTTMYISDSINYFDGVVYGNGVFVLTERLDKVYTWGALLEQDKQKSNLFIEEKQKLVYNIKTLQDDDFVSDNYNLLTKDVGALIRVNADYTSIVNIVIKNDKYYPINSVITIRQSNTAQVNIAAETGITLNGDTKTAGQNKSLQIIKVGPDEWDIEGGVA